MGTLTALTVSGISTFTRNNTEVALFKGSGTPYITVGSATNTGGFFQWNGTAGTIQIGEHGETLAISINGAATTLGGALTVNAGGVAGHAAPRVTIPASAFYTAGTAGTWAESVTGAHQTTQYELKFDASADEKAEIRLQIPRNYAGGNITIRIQWHANATSGAAVWDWVTYNTAPAAVFDSSATGSSATTTTDATANDLNETVITWSANLPAAGDHLEARLTRDANSGDDTLAVDAEVHHVIVEFGS